MTNPTSTKAQAAISAIKLALDAGPTPGEWKADLTRVYIGRKNICSHVNPAADPGLNLMDANDRAVANAAFIAAANPEAIRTLLALVEAQRSILQRLVDANRGLATEMFFSDAFDDEDSDVSNAGDLQRSMDVMNEAVRDAVELLADAAIDAAISSQGAGK